MQDRSRGVTPSGTPPRFPIPKQPVPKQTHPIPLSAKALCLTSHHHPDTQAAAGQGRNEHWIVATFPSSASARKPHLPSDPCECRTCPAEPPLRDAHNQSPALHQPVPRSHPTRRTTVLRLPKPAPDCLIGPSLLNAHETVPVDPGLRSPLGAMEPRRGKPTHRPLPAYQRHRRPHRRRFR